MPVFRLLKTTKILFSLTGDEVNSNVLLLALVTRSQKDELLPLPVLRKRVLI